MAKLPLLFRVPLRIVPSNIIARAIVISPLRTPKTQPPTDCACNIHRIIKRCGRGLCASKSCGKVFNPNLIGPTDDDDDEDCATLTEEKIVRAGANTRRQGRRVL